MPAGEPGFFMEYHMTYVLAMVAALAIISFGMSIVVWGFILIRLRALEAMEIWMRSAVNELGRLLMDLRAANDFQSGKTKTTQDSEDPGSTSTPNGT